MTPEEAIRKLCVYSSTNGSGQCTSAEHLEAKKIALKAIERQMPKKPLTIKHDEDIKIGSATWKAGVPIYKCPDCNGFVSRSSNYCPDCGQEIDWSDNNEIG